MDFSEAGWLRSSRPPTGRSTTELLDLASFATRSVELAEAIAAEDAGRIVECSSLPGDLTHGVAFLLEIYRGRKRKVMQAPALLHPLRAAMAVREIAVPAPPGAQAAALFHDYVEDTSGAADEAFFSELGIGHAKEVARWVDCLTRRGDESYVAHITRVCSDRTAVMLKAADAIDNLLDLRAAPESVEDETDLRAAFAQAAVAPTVHHDHPPTPRIRGEARLYAGWKCFSLLNLAHPAAVPPFAGEEPCRRAGRRQINAGERTGRRIHAARQIGWRGGGGSLESVFRRGDTRRSYPHGAALAQ